MCFCRSEHVFFHLSWNLYLVHECVYIYCPPTFFYHTIFKSTSPFFIEACVPSQRKEQSCVLGVINLASLFLRFFQKILEMIRRCGIFCFSFYKMYHLFFCKQKNMLVQCGKRPLANSPKASGNFGWWVQSTLYSPVWRVTVVRRVGTWKRSPR